MSALTATCILKTLSFYSPLEASPQDHSRSCPAVFAALPHGCLVGPLNLSMIKTTCQALQASLSLAFPSSADSITSHPIAHTKDWDLTPDSLSLTHSPCNPEQVIGTSPLNDHNSVSTRLSASVLAPLLFAVHTDAGPVDLKHKSDHIALLHEALRGVPPALKSKPRPALQALLSGLSPRLWTCYLLFQFHCISGYSCFFASRAFHILLLLGILFSEIFKWLFPLIWGLNWNDATLKSPHLALPVQTAPPGLHLCQCPANHFILFSAKHLLQSEKNLMYL